jgi:hypothetical protein
LRASNLEVKGDIMDNLPSASAIPYTSHFERLEKSIRDDDPLKGTMTFDEFQEAYKNNKDTLPEEVTDKFGATIEQDEFQMIDRLGVDDELINDQEFYAAVFSDSNFTPWTPDPGAPGAEQYTPPESGSAEE